MKRLRRGMLIIAVNVATVTDVRDSDHARLIIDAIDDAVFADADPPALTSLEFFAPRWPWISAERQNCVSNSSVVLLRKRCECLLRCIAEKNLIVHSRASSISLMACSSGMYSPPSASASS